MTIQLNGSTGIVTPSIDLTIPLAVVDGGSKLKQIVTYQTGAVATGTNIIPYDNTIPQSTEGNEYMTLSITPSDASSTLEIDVHIQLGTSVAGNLACALFQDSNINALAASTFWQDNISVNKAISFKHIMQAGTTSITTFKVRAGADRAATTTFNGISSAQYMGGVMSSRITIKEYLP